ncbi:hypothetical protein GCM10010521_00130 [Streptomyces rameus]|uniref:Uncharacterized protein n=1 Tax=Streptomyces rameus TaxID=68261 RepID=A0ABP6MJ43_9ACTN
MGGADGVGAEFWWGSSSSAGILQFFRWAKPRSAEARPAARARLASLGGGERAGPRGLEPGEDHGGIRVVVQADKA